MSSDPVETYKYYNYEPSLAGACVFAILFGASTAWHTVLIAKHRTCYFIPLLIGGVFQELLSPPPTQITVEITGYTARGASSQQPATAFTITPYIIQTLWLLVAPALFAASIYMILGRIIVSVDGEKDSLVRKMWLTKIFVMSDVASFLLQLGGGGLTASSNASISKLGSHIIPAGLQIQILAFGCFLFPAATFHRRFNLHSDTTTPATPTFSFSALIMSPVKPHLTMEEISPSNLYDGRVCPHPVRRARG
ncbi:hypothetical protein MMC25_005988 [Agyrium rufum]|nr:hypothetical protein [Agyrium rufum]